MRGCSLWVVAWAACVLGASSGPMAQRAAAQATASGQAESSYEALIREALSEFNAGDYAEARALFERAHALKPNARTLRGLGITAFELKRYVESVNELEAALAETRTPLTDAQRTEVQGLVLKARRFVGKIKLEVTPSNASVVLDGRPSASADLVLNLGEHQVSVRAPGYRDEQLKLVIDGGEDTSQRVELVSLDVSPKRAALKDPGTGITHGDGDGGTTGGSILGKWWFWTAAGVVLAGVAVGTGVALSGSGGGQQPLYQGNARSVSAP